MLVLNRIISDIQLVSLNIFTPKKKSKQKQKGKTKNIYCLGGYFKWGRGGGGDFF